MSGWLGIVELAALAGLLAALATVAAWPLLDPWLRAGARRLAPEARARLWTAAAAAPLALPALLLGICLLPSLLGAIGLHRDHCPLHAEHPHLCVRHRPAALAPPWAAVSWLAAAPLVGAIAVGGAALGRSRRLRRSLAREASGALRDDVELVDSPGFVSLTVGALRPRVFVSRRLAEALSPGELEVVIEHERAHARRRDGLRKLAAAALSWMHWPPLRRRLLRELALACEQACDAGAARRVGDRLRVAETILAAERLLARDEVSRAACAFGGSTVPERVERLLAPEPSREPSKAALRAAWLAAAAAALAVADPLHHWAEHWLARLVH
jgi:Zn-dependent protease with chaperone function